MRTPPTDPRADLREHLAELLAWRHAHADLASVLEGVPPADRGRRPPGLPYSPWELLEHLRIAQRDILEFCTSGEYRARRWPDDYWPGSPAPPSDEAWTRSVSEFRAELEAVRRLAADPAVDLFAPVPAGKGQTFLREILLVADHNAYHAGQLVAVRRLLGNWPGNG